MPVQSAITFVQEVSGHVPDYKTGHGRIYWLDDDHIALEGYAFSGGGREIIRVDVSADGGRTWTQAELFSNSSPTHSHAHGSLYDNRCDGARKGSRTWTWKRWKMDIPKMTVGGKGEYVVKAVDESYNTQPEGYVSTWNFRGNLTCS